MGDREGGPDDLPNEGRPVARWPLSSPPMSLRLLTLALAVITSLAPLTSRAQEPVVAVTPFAGRRAGAVTRLVGGALDDRVDLVSRGATTRAARSAGLEGTNDRGVRDLADALNADIVVLGEVSGTRRRTRVEIVMRSSDGAELASGNFVYRGGARGRRDLETEVASIWDRALAAWRALSAPAPVERAIRDEPQEDTVEESSEAPQDGLAVLALTAGLTVRSRDTFVSLTGGGERRYSVPAYVELGFGLEVRPFAGEGHLGRGIYLNGDFANSVGLASQVEDPTMPTPVGGTNFLRFGIHAGWLAPIGAVVELGVGFGGGYDGYMIDMNPILPSVEVGYLRPAARARIRLAQESLVLEIDLAYRAILGVGALASSFGVEIDAHGVDFGLGLTGNLFRVAELGFTWSARFSYVGYFVSFAGAATDEAGTSGSEQAIRFAFMVGWSF